jgi:hypothetical protein
MTSHATYGRATGGAGPSAAQAVAAIALGALSVTAAVISVGLIAALSSPDLTVDVLLGALAVLALAAVGTILATRVPANAVGWLLLVAGFLLGVRLLAFDYEVASREILSGSWPGTDVAAWLDNNLLGPPLAILVLVIPLVYPDGRLLSRRWRWLVGLIVVMTASGVLAWFRPGLIPFTNVDNPFGILGMEPLLDVLVPATRLATVLAVPCALASVVIRFRRGDAVERTQLKWLLTATAMAGIALLVSALTAAVGAIALAIPAYSIGLLAFSALPVAIGIAVLRYRLYEIDRIISRTIGWAIVTGLLVSVFAAGVVALQMAFADLTQGNTIAVAVSTLAVAALFQPLRRRVQHAVDRRFDRARYDTQRTVDAFAERLRDEVALDAVEADLRGTITGSVKPSSYALWLRRASQQRRSIDGP